MKLRTGAFGACLVLPTALTIAWAAAAGSRLQQHQSAAAALRSDVAIAAPADQGYCSTALKRTLRRVLQSCGLLDGGRGCQPLQARTVATVSGGDFNALFAPMKLRGGIVEFDQDKAKLDADDRRFVDEVFSERRGASYFFVVGRASPDGPERYNRKLSRQRAEAVMEHLRAQFEDPELERQVGLLWLGEEFAQLQREFCNWRRSSGQGSRCDRTSLNRSAFVAWIDCQL